MPPRQHPCPTCRAAVFPATDIDTDVEHLIDAQPVDGGHVDVWTARHRASCARHAEPSHRQPAHELHTCPGVKPPPLPDPYADDPAADQQHGGWR